MRILSFLLRYLRRYVAWTLLALVAVVTFGLTSAAAVSLIEPVFGEVLLSSGAGTPLATLGTEEPGDEPDSAATGQLARLGRKFNFKRMLNDGYRSLKRRFGVTPENVLYFVPLLLLGVTFVRSLSDFVSGYAFQRIGLGITTDIRNDLFQRLLEHSSHFHRRHPSGELVSRVVNDVTVMQGAVSSRVLDLVQQSVTLVLLVALLLSTDVKLTLIFLIASPLAIYPIFRFGQGMRHTSHRSQERMADLTELMTEATRGYRIVKAFGMEEFEVRRFRVATQRHLKVKLRSQVFANVSGPVVGVMGAVGIAAFLVYAGRAIRVGQLTGPLVVQFLANLLLLYDPVRRLNKVNLVLQEGLAAVRRIMDLMALPLEIEEHPEAVDVDRIEEGIRFDRVTFGYEEQTVLRDIDLEIRSGETVALVGPSGAGKSTLVNLLLRFFDPDSGRITVDGIDLRRISFRSLRALMALVTQETVLFNDTVRNNIAYGRADLPFASVRRAAEAAFAHEFILRMPEGYETRLGEGGYRLSGGERQRLAIARALLKNPPLLVLDEATSQLDSQSEVLVQQALRNLMRNRTTVVIAHRLSTITSADKIVLMEAGRITEVGSHEELLERGGLYRDLYELQFRTAT